MHLGDRVFEMGPAMCSPWPRDRPTASPGSARLCCWRSPNRAGSRTNTFTNPDIPIGGNYRRQIP